MAKVEDLLHRRTDLSTFLVHFTRASDHQSAEQRLLGILTDGLLRLGRPMGMARDQAVEHQHDKPEFYKSQQVVCFTETPLEHAWMMCESIESRQVHFEPYGVAFTRTWGRAKFINPVWYLDMSAPWKDRLVAPVNRMRNEALADGQFEHDIFRLTPLIEPMGTTSFRRKEFWWEREWRLAGHDLTFTPDDLVAVLVPEGDHRSFRKQLAKGGNDLGKDFSGTALIDPRWGLKQIIAKLAGVPDHLAGPW